MWITVRIIEVLLLMSLSGVNAEPVLTSFAPQTITKSVSEKSPKGTNSIAAGNAHKSQKNFFPTLKGLQFAGLFDSFRVASVSFQVPGAMPPASKLSPFKAGGSTPQREAERESVDRLMQSAQASMERGDLPAAAASLEQVLIQDEKNKTARVALINVLAGLMRWGEAENHAQILNKQFPGDTEPTLLLAMIALRRGNPQQACDLANKCLSQGDNRPEVYKLLALAHYLLQQYDKFEAHIHAALQQNPRDPEAHYHLARFFYEGKRYKEAFNSFQEVIKLQPDHYKARYYAGLLYQGMDQPERAKEEFLASIEIIERKKVRYAWPFVDLGRQLVNEGETDRGIGWLYRGIRNDPAAPQAHYEYAKALFQQGATPDVKQELLMAIRLDPGYSSAYYLLARYYLKIGEKQLANEAFARFEEVKKNPTPSPYGLRRW